MEIKVDMANAFDWVQHSFLFAIMENFGFDLELIHWIKAYILDTYITPLLNGRNVNTWNDIFPSLKILKLINRIEGLKDWMRRKGKQMLYDIFEWFQDSSWKGWLIRSPPQHLRQLKKMLIKAIQGYTLVDRNISDARSWKSTPNGYRVKLG